MIPGRVLCYTVAAHASRPSYDTIRLMTEMRDEGVKSFVGLHQSCAVEASVAAAWDFPLISYVSDQLFLNTWKTFHLHLNVTFTAANHF